jgi:hypothetical protein
MSSAAPIVDDNTDKILDKVRKSKSKAWSSNHYPININGSSPWQLLRNIMIQVNKYAQLGGWANFAGYRKGQVISKLRGKGSRKS